MVKSEHQNTAEHSHPILVVDKAHIIFNDVKKGSLKHSYFILRNIGAPYKKIEIFTSKPDSFVKITHKEPLDHDQPEGLPLKVFFEAKAEDWSRLYSENIIVRLDNQEKTVLIELDTQTKPVNDFAKIFKPKQIIKITKLINRLERRTSAEIAVVTTDSLEGKTIDEYAYDLFNTWKIGKEDKHNGILFLIDTNEKKYRIEVGLGLEKLITENFINQLSDKIILTSFRAKKFGAGVYRCLNKIAAKLYKDQKS